MHPCDTKPYSKAVRDAASSHKTLIQLFERINFFLQRLEIYTQIPLTEESTELLGKIMAQLLSILALSTKAMEDKGISECWVLSAVPRLIMTQRGF